MGPVSGNYLGSVFSLTQIIWISISKFPSIIVNILWLFEKIHPGECDCICDYSIIAILEFVTSQTV